MGDLANIMSNYFEEKVKTIKRKLHQSNLDPCEILKKSLDKWSSSHLREKFDIKEISLIETLEILKELKNTTTMGTDGLDPFSLKLVAATLGRPLQHVVNLSIKKKIFCNKWKIGKIIPLFKGGKLDRQQPSSYRPIAILPIIAKIAERAVQRQVVKFMETSKQLNSNMHAYRKMYNTTTAVLQITDYIITAAENKRISNVMLIDQSAAFDCVEGDILIEKLKLYNFSDETCMWFRSYMDSRSQVVSIGASVSNYKSVNTGVPQGSVMGPIMYLIYTNELPELIKEDDCINSHNDAEDNLFGNNCEKCGTMACFADDCTLVIAKENRTEI